MPRSSSDGEVLMLAVPAWQVVRPASCTPLEACWATYLVASDVLRLEARYKQVLQTRDLGILVLAVRALH